MIVITSQFSPHLAFQEGYNVDLLNEQATPPRSTNPQSVVPKEQYQSIGPGAGARKVPFWRTRNGLITLAIAAIVIVGAVVGGAVGGTVGQPAKKEAAKAATGVSNVTSAPSNASQSQINVAPVASAPTTPPNNGTR